MSKPREAKKILQALGMPDKLQSDLCCKVFLGLCGLKPDGNWSEITNDWVRIYDILFFMSGSYGVKDAMDHRNEIRTKVLRNFLLMALIEDNGLATNNSNHRYRMTEEFFALVHTFQTEEWDQQLQRFLQSHDKLVDIYKAKRDKKVEPIRLYGKEYPLSPNRHSELQKAVMESFVPRFVSNSECLYLKDSPQQGFVINEDRLSELGFHVTDHKNMPDIILYREDKDWMYFVESVTNMGPMNQGRVAELMEMAASVRSGKIFITAFLNFLAYKKFSDSLAWKTRVWIAEMPEHVIYLDEDQVL